MFRYLLLSAVFLWMSLAGYSQKYLAGTVKNQQGEVLAGASVVLDHGTRGTMTNEQGYFIFRSLKPGSYFIEVRFLGYKTEVQTVKLLKSVDIEIVLQQDLIFAGEITVKATRASSGDPVAYTNLNRSELRANSQIRDIPYLLSVTPSVIAYSDGGTGVGYSGLRIRGTDPSRTNVTINGIPFNDSESHDVYWVDLPDFISSTESIQVQRGVGTSTQGAGAFGANINFSSTSLRSQPYAGFSGAIGSFNTHRIRLETGTGLLNDKFSVDVRLSQIHSDGYIDRAFTNMGSYYLSAGWFTSKSLLKFISFSGHERTYQAWGGVPSELLETNRTYNPYTYKNEVDDYTQYHHQLLWSYRLSRNMDLNIALHYTRGKGYYEQYRKEDQLADYLIDPVIISGDTITKSDLVRQKWLDNNFYGSVFSLNYHYQHLNIILGGGWNRYDGDHFGEVIWARYASNANPHQRYYFSNGLKTDFNSFVKVNYHMGRILHAFADLQYRGIRYRIDGVDDDQRVLDVFRIYPFFNPKAGLTADFKGGHQSYISFGIANREPKRSNFTDAAPGETPLPERLYDIEIGHRITRPGWSAGINLYNMQYHNQLVLTGQINDVGAPIMVNVPDSYRRGVEWSWNIHMLKTIEWQGALTVSRNKILNFTEYVDDWDTWSQRHFDLGTTDLALSPDLIASSRIIWSPLQGFHLQWDSRYVNRQFIDNTSNGDRSIDPYWVNDFMMSYMIPAKRIGTISLFFQVLNVLNTTYESHAWVYSYFYNGIRHKLDGYFPQAGRHFMMGMSWELPGEGR